MSRAENILKNINQRGNKLKIEVPKTSAFNIETGADLPKMHFVGLSIGKRGSGKTIAIVNLLKYLQDSG
jgi:hypothetical protein